MDINWYPGHMAKAKRLLADQLSRVDVVVELCDARLPYSSRNPDLDKLLAGKKRVLLLNKADLADPAATSAWLNYFRAQGIDAAPYSASTGKVKDALAVIDRAAKEAVERAAQKGIRKTVKAMVVGVPNVGKSTFINSYAGKACAKTGNKPGVTKGKQWIRLSKSVELLDTPGILWPKFEDQKVGLRLALIGSIRDEILNTDELAVELIRFLKTQYPGILTERYEVEETQKETELLCGIAENRKCITKGGELDYSKAAALLIDEFRSGKLGKVTLEWPKEQENG